MTQSDSTVWSGPRPLEDRLADIAMLETATRHDASIDTSAGETAHDAATDPPSVVDGSPTATAGSGWLRRLLVGCLAAELAVTAVAMAAMAGGSTTWMPGADGAPDEPAETPRLSPADDEAQVEDTESFLLAWSRSLARDHTATGTLTRAVLGRDSLVTSAWPDPIAGTESPTTTVMPYRHSRLGGRVLTQIGDVATVVHPVDGRRTCIRQPSGFACTLDKTPGPDVMTAVRQAVEGPTATHRVVEIDPSEVLTDFTGLPAGIRCWEARSLSDGIDQRWGRRAQFCFHDPSGAAVFRRVLGTARVEVLVVEAISETVSPADLDPV